MNTFLPTGMHEKTIKLGLVLSMFFGLSTQTQAEVVPLDRIAAIVEDDVIMESELNQRIANIRVQMQATGVNSPPNQLLTKQVLDQMIVENLQLQMGDRAGVRVGDLRLNQEVSKIARQNGMNLTEFRAALEEDGTSYLETREQIRQGIVMQQVREQMVMTRVQLSEQELINFLNSDTGKEQTATEYRLAHILLPVSSTNTDSEIESIKRAANDLYEEAKNGQDFQQLAAGRSKGQNALRGGDLGWRKVAQLPSIFVDTVLQMELGDVAQPIKSPSGYHVIKLVNVRGSDIRIVNQTKVRHILIKPSEIRSDQEALDLATRVYERLKNGEDFEKLSRIFSEDTGSALQGGDLGWVAPGELVPAFEKSMNETAIEDYSEPFKSPFGWHVLQVNGRRQDDQSEEYRRAKAANFLGKRKYDEELARWLQEIKDEAFIEVKI